MARTQIRGNQQILPSSVDLTTDVLNALPVANGGTGATNLGSNAVVLGNGTGAVNVVAPSTAGNVLTDTGTNWISSPAPPSPLTIAFFMG